MSACDHEYTKVFQNARPEPDYWTCNKCLMVASDTTVILLQIGRLSAKVDQLTKSLVPPVVTTTGDWPV